LVNSGGDYGSGETFYTNCNQGTICEDPLVASLGNMTAPAPNTFYTFTAAETGMYDITTCGLSTCDTKLWIYSSYNKIIDNFF
jgi:hypothetical protein